MTNENRLLKGALLDLAAVGLLVALCLFFFWRILTPDPVNRASFPAGDFQDQFYSYAYYKASRLSQGQVPLWNPYVYGGHPFVADIQSAVFYPLGLVTVLLAGKEFPLFALEVEAIAHIFLASLFMYLLARRLVGGRFPSLVASVVFAYGGYLTSYPIQQLAILEVQVWLPLVVLFAHLSTEKGPPQSVRPLAYAALGGIALGVSLLAGHPQAFLYVLYATVFYLAFRLACLARDGGIRQALRGLPSPLALLALGFGLAAVQLLPTLEFMGLSSRAEMGYVKAAWGFPLKDMLQVVLPGSVSLYSPMYVGILPLVLAGLAVAFVRHREVLFWALVAALALLVSFGGHTFLYSPLYLLAPGFSIFRDQERAVYLFSFAMALLAGYGSAAFLEKPWRGLLRFLLWSSPMAFCLLLAFYVLQGLTGRFEKALDASAYLLLLLLMAAFLVYLQSKGTARLAIVALALGMVVFDLFSANWQNNVQDRRPEDFFRGTPLMRHLQGDSGGRRVHNEFRLPLNYGDVFGVRDINGASPLVVAGYQQLLSRVPYERLWRLLGVGYFLTWRGDYPAEKLFTEKLPNGEEMHLYRLAQPAPRAWVVQQAAVASGEAALELLASPGFDPAKVVVLPREPPVPLADTGADGWARLVENSPERLVWEAGSQGPGLLVLSEVYYPGWKAWVDGIPTEVLLANHALRAVPLPGGTHRVEMAFSPDSFTWGWRLSTIAALVAMGLVLRGLRWRR